MIIRDEQERDFEQIWAINAAAFEGDGEANLVNVLRDAVTPFISLVAEQDDTLVGHILFTPVDLAGDDSDLMLMGLGPVAVLPNVQRTGIGSALIRSGIERCRAMGCDALVVLGHANYYPKFGFVPSVNYGITSEYDVPVDVFMMLELTKNCLHDKQGMIKYHEAFSGV